MASYVGVKQSQMISLEEPTEFDNELSAKLDQELNDSCSFEDEAGMKKRNDLVDFLRGILRKWVSQIAQTLGINEEDSGATALPFGGHQLGTVMKDSDIDIVCIVPNFVNRKEFFTSFTELLQGEPEARLSHIRIVTGARVPIIECCMRGFEVDLSIARLSMSRIPESIDLSEDKLLEHMDETDVYCLNGVRHGKDILDLVPNIETFSRTLKAVKLWAKHKGLSTYPLGYPGGIAWAIMVARVCQLYPNAAPATLVAKVFLMFKNWDWPRPVFITPLVQYDPYHLNPWNPTKNHVDTYDIMPIITSTYPQQNCAYTVNHSALIIVQEHMEQAYSIMENIKVGQTSWKELFKKTNFFSLYKHYLMLKAQADTPQQIVDWSGMVFAKCRTFVEDLENQPSIAVVHTYPKTYKEGCSRKWFWGLRFNESKGVKLYLAENLQRFLSYLITLAEKRDIYRPGMRLEVHHVRRKDLSNFIPSEDV